MGGVVSQEMVEGTQSVNCVTTPTFRPEEVLKHELVGGVLECCQTLGVLGECIGVW